MIDIITDLEKRVMFHKEQLSYMTISIRDMYMHEGAIKELMELIEYLKQNYDSMP